MSTNRPLLIKKEWENDSVDFQYFKKRTVAIFAEKD